MHKMVFLVIVTLIPSRLRCCLNFRSFHELYVTYLHGHVTIQSNQKTGDVSAELKCNARTLSGTWN